MKKTYGLGKRDSMKQSNKIQYDFDVVYNRYKTSSSKWNVKEGELPLSMADMDFKTAPSVIEALQKKVNFGIFGYTDVTDEWKSSIIHWWKIRHQFVMRKEWLMFCIGTIPAISSIIRKLTTPAEFIVVLTPIYNIFFNSIINNGRQVLECPLLEENEKYSIDFKDLELKLSHPQTTMMILCNPHNPIGKVWKKEELENIGRLCHQYNVIVITDELHCDLTDLNIQYVPFASISRECKENSITCISPSKAFNLAGIQSAAMVIPNEKLRLKVHRGINTDEIAEPNAFAMEATIAAYRNSFHWLESLREYIYGNKTEVRRYIETNIPELKVLYSDATYLLWIDCSELKMNANVVVSFLREKTGLVLSSGSQYRGNGDHYLRMNVAYPRSVIKNALSRLDEGIQLIKKEN